MTKDQNDNANDLGGPSFHPDVKKHKAPDKGAPAENDNKSDGSILDEDQVPPL